MGGRGMNQPTNKDNKIPPFGKQDSLTLNIAIANYTITPFLFFIFFILHYRFSVG